MEKRQLDFNKPLLSARRYTSPSRNNSTELGRHRMLPEKPPPSRQQSLTPDNSDWEWESGEVVKPAAVPFQWEHTPGRPKNEPTTLYRTPDEPSTTPKLPPSRLSDAIRRHSGPVRYNSGELNIYKHQVEAYDQHASILDELNKSLNCRDESDSESEEDTYSDALDTLSGSWSFGYSVGGLSEDSGTFSVDTQTRDFMMDRFLPAAKAVALDTPKHHAVKKAPTVLREEPREVRRLVKSGEVSKPSFKPYSSPHVDNVESEDDEDEKSSSVVAAKKPGKGWGIFKFPRFCVKNSLCLLNPLPAMKLNLVKQKSRPPLPLSGEIGRMKRNAHSGPLDKNAYPVPQKIKFHSGLLPRELPKISTKLTNDYSNQFLNSSSPHISGLSPLKSQIQRSRSISPYRNESPRSPFREGVGFLGVPKEVENYNANKIASSRKMFNALQDVSRNQTNERASGPQLENALYKDPVIKTSVPISKPTSTKVASRRTEASKPVKDISRTNILDEGKKLSPRLNNRNVDRDSKPLAGNELVPYDPPVKSPITPPLPKSPAESWLWRKLPVGNPFSQSPTGSPARSSKKGQITEKTKWETIVKSSNLRPGHDNVRHSEELMPHVLRNKITMWQ